MYQCFESVSLQISLYYVFVSKFGAAFVSSTFRQLREYSLSWKSVFIHTSHMTCPSEVCSYKLLFRGQDDCAFEYLFVGNAIYPCHANDGSKVSHL